jgi:histone-lysine N-methyltransferase SETMAR
METWQWIKQGQGNLSDLTRSGHPSTAVTPATVQRADSLIRDNRRITTRELTAVLGIGKGSVDKIIHQLGYSKVCARWVPRSLTEEHKQQRKAICSELLAHYEAEGDDLLSNIVTGDETWIHHFRARDEKALHAVASHEFSSEKKNLKQLSQSARSWQQSFGYVKGSFS